MQSFKLFMVLILIATVYFGLNHFELSSNSGSQKINIKKEPQSIQKKERLNTEHEITESNKMDLPKKSTLNNASSLNYYEKLLLRVNNNQPDAQYELSKLYQKCDNIPETESGLKKKLSSIKDDYLKQNIQENYISCYGVKRKKNQNQSWRDLLMSAARNGHIDAKLEFGNAIPNMSETDLVRNSEQITNLKNETLQHMLDARNLGSVKALLQLGSAYEDGILMDRDYVESYAHYLAYNSTNMNGHIIDPQRYIVNLTQEEILIAIRRSKIYEKCCI